MRLLPLPAALAALALPLLVPLGAAHAGHAPSPAYAAVRPGAAQSATGVQSLPLRLLPTSPTSGGVAPDGASPAVAHGLPATPTQPFSLLGVVWDDPDEQLRGRVEVRTRDAGTGSWSDWRELAAGGEHGPGPGSAESGDAGVRGGTAPLWVGASDAVQVRVSPDDQAPGGLRVELIDPDAAGDGADGQDGQEAEVLPAEEPQLPPEEPESGSGTAEEDYVGPRPGIVTRAGWGADESLRESGFLYTDRVRTAFVHHTAGSNDYACKDADSVIRGIYSYHVLSLGWRDVGYNFFVDRCGTIYEGRAGGVIEPVQGAHTYGHNHNSMGIAILGSFGDLKPSKRSRDGVAKLTAWKLGLFGVNPLNSQVRISGGGLYPAGTEVRLNNISGHRDGYATECPGDMLYDSLPYIRGLAADLQGR